MTTLISVSLPFVVDIVGDPNDFGVAEKEVDEIVELAEYLRRDGAASTVGSIVNQILCLHPWRFNRWFSAYGALRMGTNLLPLNDKLKEAEFKDDLEAAIRARDENRYDRILAKQKKEFLSSIKG